MIMRGDARGVGHRAQPAGGRLSRPNRALLVVGLAMVAASMQAAEVGDAAATSARISAERAEIELRFAAAQAACQQQFFVTACLDAAGAERRHALTALQQRQNLLDDARRRDKAAQRLQSIEQRQSQVREPGPRLPAPIAVPRALPASAAARPAALGAAAPSAEQITEREQQSLAAHQRRLDAARQHQLELQQRLDRQDTRRKPAVGLPLPGASDASR